MTLSDKDPRVQAAIELLTQRLEDEFARSADTCRNEFQRYPKPMVAYGYDAAPILLRVIRPWRQKSLEHISDVFALLLAVVNELEHGNTTAPDVTQQFCREAIGSRRSSKGSRERPLAKVARAWLSHRILVVS
jgi:hypothetical protein